MRRRLERTAREISSYNLFNYLLPGVLFAVIASNLTHYSFLGYEVVVTAFLYDFIGLVISRVGSLTFAFAVD